MAESAETRKLSGLARSIDALFASPPPVAKSSAPPPLVTEPPPEVVEFAEAEQTPSDFGPADTPIAPPPLPDREPPPLREVEPPPLPEVEPLPVRPEMFPASQMLDAIQVEPWAPAETPPITFDPLPVPADPVPAPVEAEPLLELVEAADVERVTDLDLLPAVDIVAEPPTPEPPTTEPTPEAPASVESEPDAAIAFRRAVAAYVAGESGAGEQVETLSAGLRDRLALDPLADAVETLVREAGDPPDARFLDLANSVINPAVASRLVQRLGQDPAGPKREEYFALCRRIGLPMANALKGALTGALDRDVRGVYREALISMGGASRPVIEGMVEDDNRFLVRDGVAILGEVGGPRAVELVTSALADTDPRVRSEALLSLGKLGDEKAAQLVLASLEDADSSVRMAAAVASGQLGLDRALRPLLHMLEKETDPEKCIPLLRALGRIGDPGAVHAIEKHAVPSLFSKPRTDVRIAAYRALHEIGTPHARDLIKQTVHDKDPVIRVALKDIARAD